jgi:hypothetical protein
MVNRQCAHREPRLLHTSRFSGSTQSLQRCASIWRKQKSDKVAHQEQLSHFSSFRSSSSNSPGKVPPTLGGGGTKKRSWRKSLAFCALSNGSHQDESTFRFTLNAASTLENSWLNLICHFQIPHGRAPRSPHDQRPGSSA